MHPRPRRPAALIALLGFGLAAAFGLGWGGYHLWQSYFGSPGLLELIAALPPEPGAAPPEAIARGPLGSRYLTESELRELRLELDLGRVKHLRRLDQMRWVLACTRGIDCIPQIEEPRFELVLEADEWLGDGDLVLSVRSGRYVKAYPLKIMAWHQVLNDQFGETPAVVVYCPLTGAGVAYVRPTIWNEPLEFGASGRLYNANLLLYDRQTGTLWQSFTGEALAGPLVGIAAPLERLPAAIVPWGEWKRAHPGGRVLARPERIRWGVGGKVYHVSHQRYEEYPYAEYELRRWVGYGVDVDRLELRGLPSKRRIVGVSLDNDGAGAAKAYLRRALKGARLLNDKVGEEEVLVVLTLDGEVRAFKRRLELGPQLARVLELEFELQGDKLVDRQTGTVWTLEGEPLRGPLASLEPKPKLEELPTTSAYWFAWVLFHPETELFPGGS